ncbi:hypothetical protein A0128_14280 [Leptospira tipperaryensis]|uniref:Uncharacterized protein n=1 Tax=Leptospira tipperaryensis TaxID=2564040 RepID=A0A1D7UZB0_9LEPT|nr:hypothetical protein A0128_14280 [Leptospira tipperaryensis]
MYSSEIGFETDFKVRKQVFFCKDDLSEEVYSFAEELKSVSSYFSSLRERFVLSLSEILFC